MTNYKKAIDFFSRHPHMILLGLLVCVTNAFLKGTGFTFLGAVVITVLFISGITGVIYRETKDKEQEIGIKGVIVESGLHFSHTILTFAEVLMIMFLNFVIAAFFVILPLMMSGYKEEGAKTGYAIMVIVAIVVLIYRLPLFLMAYFPHIITKESGKYAVIKIKEIMAKNPKIWLHLLVQFSIYSGITIYKYSAGLTGAVFAVIDVLAGMIFLVFVISDLYLFMDTLEKDEKLKERFDRNYKGMYNNIFGRFFL